MSTAPLLSRHLGDHLLVAPLAEDALGSVFRALHAADERRFVRLRILRSSELPAEAVLAAIRENAARVAALAHPAMVDRPQLDVVEDIPFMAWDETSGWTLDSMLSRVRAFGIRIPVEYALLIAERIAAALEHAHRSSSDGRGTHHGLLWPGFVSISHDAAVRVGGFGLAEAVLPSLGKPRLCAEVAPYVAPESRQGGAVDSRSDVYALGMILAELLTGRRPTVDAPAPELRAGDPRSDELEAFLYRCVAAREERFSSAIDAHREIQRMVTGNPFSLYTANLALFLYKLLNPESQLAAPSSDWESTNPVVVDGSSTMSTTRRRRAPEADAFVLAEPAATPLAAAEPAPEPVQVHAAELEAAAAEPANVEPVADAEPLEVAAAMEAVAALEAGAASGMSVVEPESREPMAMVQPPLEEAGLEEHSSIVVFRFPPEGTAGLPEPEPESLEPPLLPEEPASRAAVIPAEVTESPVLLWATAWTRPATALAAAAGLTIGAFLLVSEFRAETRASASPAVRTAKAALPPAPSFPELPPAPQPGAPQISIAAAAPVAVALSGTAGRFETAAARPSAPARPSKPAPAPSRQPAEDLRLRAALARIEADRLNAKQSASDLFGEGRNNEEEGERLLRERDYQAAELAFSRAARLFQKAQEISWEQRLRESNLASGQ